MGKVVWKKGDLNLKYFWSNTQKSFNLHSQSMKPLFEYSLLKFSSCLNLFIKSHAVYPIQLSLTEGRKFEVVNNCIHLRTTFYANTNVILETQCGITQIPIVCSRRTKAIPLVALH